MAYVDHVFEGAVVLVYVLVQDRALMDSFHFGFLHVLQGYEHQDRIIYVEFHLFDSKSAEVPIDL